MATAGTLLIVLATARFIVDCANIFAAFIRHDTRSERLAYLQDVKQPLFQTKHSIYITVLVIGDSFVVRDFVALPSAAPAKIVSPLLY